ncbi:hypothetical protein MMC27_005899 [Xylographa pallens]|nr:hypothetical protein [Xylographa pallens]
MESRLRDVMQHMEQINQAATDHLDLHALLVLAVMANWRSYINYLEGLLSEVDEKALNSRVGSTCYLDYTVTFRDAQDLELIRRKLLKTSMILRSNADVGRSLHRYINKLGKAIGPDEILSSLELFDQYTANLEMHTRIVDSLLERLTGTSKLIFHILAYRHEETSLATSTAICNNGDQIKKLTEQAATESDLMIVLTRGMHNDSKLIKILTFLALLYTPASLAAVS